MYNHLQRWHMFHCYKLHRWCVFEHWLFHPNPWVAPSDLICPYLIAKCWQKPHELVYHIGAGVFTYLYMYLYKLPCMACLCSCWFTRQKCSPCVFVALFFSSKQNFPGRETFDASSCSVYFDLFSSWFFAFYHALGIQSYYQMMIRVSFITSETHRSYRFSVSVGLIPSEMVNHHEENTIWEEYVWIFFQASYYTNPSCLLYLIFIVNE